VSPPTGLFFCSNKSTQGLRAWANLWPRRRRWSVDGSDNFDVLKIAGGLTKAFSTQSILRVLKTAAGEAVDRLF
jgi:hypothetical protein